MQVFGAGLLHQTLSLDVVPDRTPGKLLRICPILSDLMTSCTRLGEAIALSTVSQVFITMDHVLCVMRRSRQKVK